MSIRWLRAIRLVAFVLIFMLAGFYASWWYRANQQPDAPAGVTLPIDGELVRVLPEFTLADADGTPTSINAFTGGPLLINFWATWCGPCIREMPMLESVWQENRQRMGLNIVGVAIDRTEDVGPYLDNTGVTYPILIGQSDGMAAANSFGPAFVGLPFTVFVAPDGQVLMTYSGELEREQLDGILAVMREVDSGVLSVEAGRDRLQR